MGARKSHALLVEEARRLWLEGATNAQVVRFLITMAPEPYYLARELYSRAFLVGPHVDRAFIGAERMGWTDEDLERFLDRWMTEARLGGLLNAERLARYLRVPKEVVSARLEQPENKRRVGGRRAYGTNGAIIRHELYATPDLFRELEAEFLPDHPRRYPYWEASVKGQVEDPEVV
jgi:hypothetical protein